MTTRRTRVDLRTQAEKISSVNYANSNIQEDEKSLSISDEEKHLTRPKRLPQDMDSEPRKNVRPYVPRAKSNPKITREKESTGHAEKQVVISPFDICTSDNRKLMSATMLPARNIGNHVDTGYPITETRQILRPGMVLLTNYISLPEQANIINRCRELGLGPGGFRPPGYQNGTKLCLQMMCLGKMWDPETKYEELSGSHVPRSLDDSKPESAESDDEFQICQICNSKMERKKLLQCSCFQQLLHPACLVPSVTESVSADWSCISCKEKTEEYLRQRRMYLAQRLERYFDEIRIRRYLDYVLCSGEMVDVDYILVKWWIKEICESSDFVLTRLGFVGL